ncbi:MAG: AAA family ATPase [Promicromonosporaceae bacterium]|nr:AAA family ATPase [Promicromonosporaceae bacterium]
MIVLLTGMPGAGKSTVLRELAARGHAVEDLDYQGYSVLVEDRRRPVGWEQLWDVARVRARLDAHSEDVLFVAGTVSNRHELRERFDAVVLLTAPRDVLLGRVAARADNPYGQDAASRAQVEHDIEVVEPVLRDEATHVVDTDRPAAQVADEVERIGTRPR